MNDSYPGRTLSAPPPTTWPEVHFTCLTWHVSHSFDLPSLRASLATKLSSHPLGESSCRVDSSCWNVPDGTSPQMRGAPFADRRARDESRPTCAPRSSYDASAPQSHPLDGSRPHFAPSDRGMSCMTARSALARPSRSAEALCVEAERLQVHRHGGWDGATSARWAQTVVVPVVRDVRARSGRGCGRSNAQRRGPRSRALRDRLRGAPLTGCSAHAAIPMTRAMAPWIP